MSDDIYFREGLISSHHYADSYFSHINGHAETQHVFLGGNDLPARFEDAENFTIAELGFGTGLNFLTTVQALTTALTYVSFELHPLDAATMRQALSRWLELSELQEDLIAALPEPTPGIHVLHPFQNSNVQLILIYGDANTWLPRWAEYCETPVDAWYLDGFAPRRNPELWNVDLMQEVYRVTAPGGTGATYTSAGFVRRMMQDVGFEVQKVPGFANKREMTCLSKPK